MLRPVKVEARPHYRLYLEYSDEVSGEVDLSDLAGKGVFQAWQDEAFFRGVHIAPPRHVGWGNDIELCADALYLKLTGKSPEELFPALQSQTISA